ncbi:hypothetical protein NHX12_024547, partial [Muraenolepis orangiensis]
RTYLREVLQGQPRLFTSGRFYQASLTSLPPGGFYQASLASLPPGASLASFSFTVSLASFSFPAGPGTLSVFDVCCQLFISRPE